MWDEILKAIFAVFLPAMLKFILGPFGGYAAKLNIATTIIASVAGMMTAVAIITYSGDWVKKHLLHRFVKPKDPNKPPGFFSRILARYGLSGIAFFSPLFLTPIGGALLALSLNKPKDKVMFAMFISASAWAIIFTLGIYFFLDQIREWLDYIK
jgi:membrane protein DedA with SNARE-associated domain